MGKRKRKEEARKRAAARIADAENNVPAVRCKVCSKEWTDVGAYARDKGCANATCPHTKTPTTPGQPRTNIVHRREGEVVSDFDDTKESYYLDVPKIIAIDIFPPGVRCRVKKGK
jgi:hypothetical protein